MALGAKAGNVIRIVSSTAIQVGSGIFAGVVLSVAFHKLATEGAEKRWRALDNGETSSPLRACCHLSLEAAQILSSCLPPQSAGFAVFSVALNVPLWDPFDCLYFVKIVKVASHYSFAAVQYQHCKVM